VPAQRYEAVVERIHEWTPRTRSLFLRLGDGARMPLLPGQFISLELPLGERPPLVRPYSVASDPEDALLELCVDLVPGGIGSQYLFSLAAGATLPLKGPFGSLTVETPPPADTVFVAGGTGIAPIRAIVRRVLASGGDDRVQILHGAATAQDLLFRDELAALVRAHRRFSWEPILEGPAAFAGEHPALEALVFDRYVRADADRTRHFWICAVGDIVRRLREALRAAGYERRAVRYELW
jgi:ferredoxin-NADP reductase